MQWDPGWEVTRRWWKALDVASACLALLLARHLILGKLGGFSALASLSVKWGPMLFLRVKCHY